MIRFLTLADNIYNNLHEFRGVTLALARLRVIAIYRDGLDTFEVDS